MATGDSLPLHRLDVSEPGVLPFAVGSFDTIGPLSRAPFLHRHTFYEVVYVTGGRGAHCIDFVQWPLRPPHLCFIAPGQAHSWALASGVNGSVILFTDDFLHGYPGDRDTLRDLGERPWLPLTAGAASGFAALVTEMEQECSARRDGFVTVLQAYLHVLIVRARRSPSAPAPPMTRSAPASRAVTVAGHFDRMLAAHGGAERSVRGYAARVGVSVGYLNEAVKQVTGRTPGQLIRQTQVLEAKRLLAGTTLTVAQVAREVGFADSAYFCRFFRRETGVSPGGFRRATR